MAAAASGKHPTIHSVAHSQSVMVGQVWREAQPLSSQHCTSIASQHKLPASTQHTTSQPHSFQKSLLFDHILFAIAMADVETAPAEPQALRVLYCGGMFIAHHHLDAPPPYLPRLPFAANIVRNSLHSPPRVL